MGGELLDLAGRRGRKTPTSGTAGQHGASPPDPSLSLASVFIGRLMYLFVFFSLISSDSRAAGGAPSPRDESAAAEARFGDERLRQRPDPAAGEFPLSFHALREFPAPVIFARGFSISSGWDIYKWKRCGLFP